MGTISDKLMRIINTKEDIRQALISKGYDVPTSIPFKEYAKMILDLPCKVDSFPDIEGIVARYSASGLTNEQMAANPVWVDKTGNGHDLQMKNFLWGGMSGIGGYNQNFNQWGYGNLSTATQTHTSYKIELSVPSTLKTANIYSNANSIGKEGDVYDFTLNIVGLKDGALLRITKGVVSGVIERIEKDGIYKIYQPIEAGWDQSRIYIFISNPNSIDLNITIEQLPIYPGALVFDGVDDYGTCNNFPILTKEKGYTVVALRQWISMGEGIFGLVSNVKNWFNDGAFVLEYNGNNATNKFVNRPVSFGNVNIEMDLPNNFTYQTSKSYKGVPITTGSFKGTNSLFVGKLNNIIGNCSNVAIWELVFLDHDATEEELTKIKDYFIKTYPWLFPDQAWTVVGKTNEDEDRATIANITGNGNDLVLSNFGFAEGSGYNEEGEYAGYLVTDGVDDKVVSAESIAFTDTWTIITDTVFLGKVSVASGILASNIFTVYNYQGSGTIAVAMGEGGSPLRVITSSIKAFSSDGTIYDAEWNEYHVEIGTIRALERLLKIGTSSNETSYFCQLAFKFLGIYNNQILSKDDCIKAYNYLQTLKAK